MCDMLQSVMRILNIILSGAAAKNTSLRDEILVSRSLVPFKPFLEAMPRSFFDDVPEDFIIVLRELMNRI